MNTARWGFMRGEPDEHVDRLVLAATPWFGIYLHHLHDVEPYDVHSHSRPIITFTLSGSYTEQRVQLNGNVSVKTHPMRVMVMSTDEQHAITKLTGDVWTFALAGPQR